MNSQNNNNNNNWIVRTEVPEEVYTDRQELMDYFYNAALKAATRRTMSTVLLGQRRMGKTELFIRLVNRLFFEQDHKAPDAVVPVYYSFPDIQMEMGRFCLEYIENFLRYYIGFYTESPEIIQKEYSGDKLFSFAEAAKTAVPCSDTLEWVLVTYETIEKDNAPLPYKLALNVPRTVSDVDNTTIVMFLDEFQNTRLPQYGFDIAGLMQHAVESSTCPHFVTGSAMSILAKEIIGRGSLFGRFDSEVINAMSGYWGKELALRAARYYDAVIPEVMAPVVAERCGGNPFYITAVARQASKLRMKIYDEETLNEILAVDISSGFIWGELNDQVNRWIRRINRHNITKWILYLSALEENEEKDKKNRLNISRIQQEIRLREGSDVPFEDIRDVMIRLSRGDLIEYLELGDWFRRIKDPILLEFLKVWGRIEVEGHNHTRVENELRTSYQKLERRISEYKGYLAEVHMSQVLLSAQNRTLPGKFFNSDNDIQIPWRFAFVHHRFRIGSGKGREIDVLGGAGPEQWVCQSKWLENKKAGTRILADLGDQADMVMEDMKPRVVRMWIFANNGLTKEAEEFAKEIGILWSSRKEFDELLVYLGLRPLPDL
ncbi:MAG: hypothetical protein GY795_05925 [Desulfobacterales bacterium]|nr:hypothetical protein [Desulfobacterales bacterium]